LKGLQIRLHHRAETKKNWPSLAVPKWERSGRSTARRPSTQGSGWILSSSAGFNRGDGSGATGT